MKRFFIMTLIISMFALAGCTTTTDDGNTTPDSENTSQENTNQNDQNTENENKNEENDTPAQPTLTGSTLDSIAIKTLPAKTEYTAGETFDPAGLALTANYIDTYSDQSTKPSAKDLAYADIQNDLTFTGTDFAAAGTTTVTVTYKGKNATFDVTVKEPSAPLTNVTITDIDSYKIPDNFADNGNIHLDLTGEISLLKISDIAKAFPNATITADGKVSYTIKGGTERDEDPTHAAESYNTLDDNEFKDLTAFAIDGKISIDETTDIYTLEVGEPTKIRTITVGDNTTLNITGKYLDIGRNRFKRDFSSDAIINLPNDIEITTYNSEVMDATRTYITSDIAKTQFDALGLTTPNFDLAISDENLYNFAHDILDRYDSFDKTKHKLKSSSYFNGNLNNSTNVLYTGDALVSEEDRPTLKFS
ncbi:MAG: bacterial Ig-like domain-containing protein, partial [Spirochaetota bacterium]|nr:bacterial Ig-like domain-containing protein [Spirochaetota bacterium]